VLPNIGHDSATTGFWLSAIANFVKDGNATAPYSDMVALHVAQFGGFLALCNQQH